MRVPPRPATPVPPDSGDVVSVPPHRRTLPFVEKPTIRDSYRPAPIVPDDRDTTRLRRRFERDVDRVNPAPIGKSPVVRAPGDVVLPTPRPIQPILRPTPPRSGVTPRYQVPGRPVPTPTTLRPRGASERETSRGAPSSSRDRAPWSYGRDQRVFHGSGPWGVNAAGGRIYGHWYGRHCSPYYFAWCHVPTWCRWGFYSWPAYYGSYWPRYYDYCSWSYGWTSSYWCAYDPCYIRSHLWYWPSSIYAPTIVYSGYTADYDRGDDEGPSHVTIRIEDGREVTVKTAGDSTDETLRVTRDTARETPAPSRETLAERHVALADVYFRDGRYQDAVDSYLRALSFLEDDASIHFALADALFALGDYHYAAFMINKALDLDPELASLTIDKRTFYKDPATFTAQVNTLRNYAAEKAYDASAHLVLGYNLRFSGDDVGAERAFARVLEIDKRSSAAELFLRAIRSKKPDTDGK